MAHESLQDQVYTRRPHFYEVYSCSSSERLKIPVSFIRHMEGRTFGSVMLTGPSNNTWHVHLNQQNNNLFFQDGWTLFVSDHFIQCGDFLVFRYEGELCFSVQVFDRTACKKEAAFHSICSQDPSNFHCIKGLEKSVEHSYSDIVVEIVPKKMTVSSSQVHVQSNVNHQELQVGSIDKELTQKEGVMVVQEKEMSPKETGGYRGPASDVSVPPQKEHCNQHQGNVDFENIIFDSIACQKPIPLSTYSVCKMERISSGGNELEAAEPHSLSNPHFMATISASNVTRKKPYMNIPVAFVRSNNLGYKSSLTLRDPLGRLWPVKLKVRSRAYGSVSVIHRTTMTGGWAKFYASNGLKLGDLCLFQLSNSTTSSGVLIDVQILQRRT
ncbi:B3 domain-containing protein [Quillaja saponaria]|uniref:B3 domain-containing protein n=1 Tax=Quillaja saponaria TaxID=32244 RepID=A0AAD7M620_QUISA|nr:B3 domain-containing protein [Quillaja saponaria]